MGYFGNFYKNKKVIGRGTFAKVLLSKNLVNNREFAVKTFDKKNLLCDQTTNKARVILFIFYLLLSNIYLYLCIDWIDQWDSFNDDAWQP